MRLIFIIALMLTLAACGGGGGVQQSPTAPVDPPRNEPVQPAEPVTHRGASLRESNASYRWHVNPQIDLPRHGRDGLQVEMPSKGGAAVARVTFVRDLKDVLEPGWEDDAAARQRLDDASRLLWKMTSLAYMQWTRHLDYDPGPLEVQVGDLADSNCFHPEGFAVACYSPARNRVILSTGWITERYGDIYYRLGRRGSALEEIFWVVSHEAGHRLDYEHRHGSMEGCGDDGNRCHAPYGSGSVMSYDHRQGRSVRYNVTEEDVRHIPNAAWNGDEVDRYTVSKSAVPPSIDGWGVWIDHRFRVSGRTAPARLFGGNLSITDGIAGTGWVRGKPSTGVSLTGTATWSGQDNFLGVDLGPDYLGALLRADANLRYTFGDRPNLNLRVNNFEAHYASDGVASTWHNRSSNDNDWGDFSYSMDCTSGGCSGAGAAAKWYADGTGDPSGWVGGVVNDRDNAYAGSFVAEKD